MLKLMLLLEITLKRTCCNDAVVFFRHLVNRHFVNPTHFLGLSIFPISMCHVSPV